MGEDGFWNDNENAQKIVAKLKTINSILKPLEEAIAVSNDLEALEELAREDGSLEEELASEALHLERLVDSLELTSLLAGNHDYYTATLLRAAMKGWFHKIEEVEVIESLLNRQYIVYGDSLLSFLHGDIGSTKDWPAIIAGEERVKWGATEHKFIFTGHFHTERELPTFGNVVVYRMPSLAGSDAWHVSKGYKSRKSLIAYIVSKSRGVISQEIEPVE